MATVNTIKTRILNKYDLLANYTNFTPLKGEVCVAVIGEEQTTNKGLKGDVSKKPIVGIKVGDGSTSFNELPWIQAVAGDVSTFVKGIVDEAKFNELVNALITNAKLAAKDDLDAVDARLLEAEGDIDDLEAIVVTGDNSNEKLRAAINAVLGTAGDTSAMATVHGAKVYAEEKAAAAKSEAITAAANDAAAKYELKDVAKGLVDALAEGAVADNATAIEGINAAIGETTYVGDSLTAAIANLQASVGTSGEGLGAQVETLKGRVDGHDTAIGTLQTDVGNLQTAISDTGALGSRVVTLEGEMDVVQAATAGYSASKTIASDIQAAKDAASAAQSKADANEDTLEVLVGTNASDANKSIRDIAALVISEALVGGGDDFDTLQEIAAWLKDHPEDVGEINAAIQSVKANLGYGVNEDGSEKVPATVDSRIASAIAAENLSQYATDTELGEATDRIAALEAAVGEEGEGSVADRIEDAKEELIGASTDASTANTVYGAKAYAEEKAAAAQSAAEKTAADDATAKANKALEDATALVNTEKARAEKKEGELNDAIVSVGARIDALDYTDAEDGVVATVSQTDGKISVTHKKVGVADLADEVFVFYCGNATGYAEDMKTVNI